ncbi:MAG: uncharacterized protein A8A55_2157 [Amphiamblys sp. WSBS2006]|nr:MAG: uncharacterized protein A8A55_2157 [Amphiamblys sp. WSBS2006]
MDSKTDTLMLENTFFVFTEKKIFVVSRAEYESIQIEDEFEDEFLSVKRKYLSAEAGSDDERVLCILCHEETKPEDLVSPLCRAMHFVICKGCVQDIKERENREVVECPFCREETNKKEYHSEIIETVFSLRTQQTLLGLEVRPDMEVKSVAELALNSKVVLRNISISDKMDVRGGISLFEHRSTQMCCRVRLPNETNDRIDIRTIGCNKEGIGNIDENIKTIQKRRINIEASCIYATGKGVCILLKQCTVDACYCSLGITEQGYIEEILGDENQRVWAGKAKNLQLRGYAVNLLPYLVENQMQEIYLSAGGSCHVSRILEAEDRSIWVGNVKKLDLVGSAVEILPKLQLHEEVEMEELSLSTGGSDQISKILEAEDNSVWVGKVKILRLEGDTIEILPKLKLHEENVMEELHLHAYSSGHVNRILEAEDRSIWVGKVKRLSLKSYTIEILPKLQLHEEVEMEELHLRAYSSGHANRILEAEDRSIWVGKVKTLRLAGSAVEILPKLRFCEETEIEEIYLCAGKQEDIAGILRKENRSILVGRVKKLRLYGHVLQVLPKLRIHGGDRIENLLETHSLERIAEMLGERRKNDWTKEHEKKNFFNEVFEFKFRSQVSRKRRRGDI